MVARHTLTFKGEHTVASGPVEGHPNHYFYNIGLGPPDSHEDLALSDELQTTSRFGGGPGFPVRSLAAWMQLHGHTYIDILKVVALLTC